MSNRYVETTQILTGNTTSRPVSLEGSSLVAIVTPSGLDGTSLTFMASEEKNGTYKQMTSAFDGSNVTALITTDKHVSLLVDDFFAAKFIKIVSSATETGDRTFELIMKHA